MFLLIVHEKRVFLHLYKYFLEDEDKIIWEAV